MGGPSEPLGIDLSTTLVGSGVTLTVSGVISEYGSQIEQFTSAELSQSVGLVFLGCGLLLALLIAVRGSI